MRADITLLAGAERPESTPWQPFDPRVLDFLAALSEAVRMANSRGGEEEATFGFWCRRSHLEALARRHASPFHRLGRGLLFHVAPSNVPAVFAYSLAIGLLSGSANVVRLSQRCGKEEKALCVHIRAVLDRPEFAPVRARTSLITYPRDAADVTAAYMAECGGRVIWGGDSAIAAIRAVPMPPGAVEVCFPDRWSLAVLSQAALSGLDGEELSALARRFYNDTYSMDQLACSSPRLVVWLADGGGEAVRGAWWNALAEQVGTRYERGPYQAVRRYELACRAAMTMTDPTVAELEWYGGGVCVARLERAPARPAEFKAGFGLFFQCELPSLEGLLPLLSSRVQTLTCAGLSTEETTAFLVRRGAPGVNRVVRVGQALEMDTVWDGKDLISALSRIVQ